MIRTGGGVSSPLADPFAPLEEALTEASTLALREAKRLEKELPRAAVEKLREYKAYQQELVVLKSRRQAGAQPALFRWQVTRKETPVENLEIGEDQVRVCIEGAYDLESVLEGHTSRNISVSYLLGLNKGEEEPVPVVTSQSRYENGRVEFNHTATYSVLKRGRHVQQLYSRKKAQFDLVLHRGFFKANLAMCQVVLPLGDLLTRCEIGGALPLTSAGLKEGATTAVSSVKKGKAVGGTLKVSVKIRAALLTPEVRVTEERKLIVDPWPASAATTPERPLVAAAPAPVNAATQRPPSTELDASGDAPPNPALQSAVFAGITQKEKDDPHSPDLLDSNDVLEAEISRSEQLLQNPAALDEDEQFNTNMRLQLLRGKLQILVFNVQNETLSLEDYLASLKARVARDQVLAVYFKTAGDPASVETALRILRRVKIMKEEIKNAEEAGGEEEA